MDISVRDYLLLLGKWFSSAEKYLYSPPGRPDLLCYGTGYDGWGVQTNQKAMVAYAVVAADPDGEEEAGGFSREELREKALRMLRFSLSSHLEGDYHCLDGRKWGHTWISVLGLERMMPGLEILKDYLTESDRLLLRKVLLSEADWLLHHYEIKAGLVENNRPESNLWNGCFLHRVARLYPDHPAASQYREKGTCFLINGISLPQDASSEEEVEGRKVKDWFVGANFFESYACNHHGYLNVGYMVICLSQVALLHFSCRLAGWDAPVALYRHVPELWCLVKTFTFPDGRLLRIGGDTRIRYCYCQDYCIPTWLLAQDYLNDSQAGLLEANWLKIVKDEVQANGDGSFLKKRCRGLEAVSPLYYTRLEADRAVSLSMAAYWRRHLRIEGKRKIESLREWFDSYHGACFQKGEKRVVSFCWQAAQPPQILCLPVDGSNLAEWRENLAGRVFSLARYHSQQVQQHQEHLFPGGFLVTGHTTTLASSFPGEGQQDRPVSSGYLVVAALPDDCSLLVMQRQVSCSREYFSLVQGLLLNVPNDIFNRGRRLYYAESGKYEVYSGTGERKIVNFNSSWLNIDDRLSLFLIYGGQSLYLYQSGQRQAGLLLGQYEAQVIETGLAVDEICYPCWLETTSVDEGTLLYDLGVLIQVGISHQQTARMAKKGISAGRNLPEGIRKIKVLGADGFWYLLVANFEKKDFYLPLEIFHQGKILSLTENKIVSAVELKQGQAFLFRLES